MFYIKSASQFLKQLCLTVAFLCQKIVADGFLTASQLPGTNTWFQGQEIVVNVSEIQFCQLHLTPFLFEPRRPPPTSSHSSFSLDLWVSFLNRYCNAFFQLFKLGKMYYFLFLRLSFLLKPLKLIPFFWTLSSSSICRTILVISFICLRQQFRTEDKIIAKRHIFFFIVKNELN